MVCRLHVHERNNTQDQQLGGSSVVVSKIVRFGLKKNEAPTRFCASSGGWNHLIGECACKPGFSSELLRKREYLLVNKIVQKPFFMCYL
ncbi:unnamed protein product [Cylicocyclus nassatus]|uniref:Uncharacterized protein n=1 Tax=Cylicocyclus nassatus TaxID=53992 RepID=A0AA36H320_CYLNA|nr:unnamed protein product [Cylicocyclus nassatus]